MGMVANLVAIVMSASFFNPSFAFSSHFDPDGTPLSELSWSSSLVVVAVSFSGLFTFIFLMLACLCCKKGGIGFKSWRSESREKRLRMVLRCLPCTGASTVPKTACNVELGNPGQPSPCPLTKEFENAEGEEYASEFSAQGSPATQNGPEVYILPLTEVSLPMSRQPGRSVQLLKSTDLGRHSLLYLKEIGHGWFGKVFLGEVNAGLSSTQVVVKELKASASVQDQMQFLEEAQPYRALQHTNLLQCLAQCAEVTPYLLVMEFCPLGDLKGYLRSCHAAEALAPDPLTLQRMACEVSCGLLHLHRNNYVHSDLALRNCLLTADLTVKIGDYGLSHCKYKDDYFVTADQLWVPLRWVAPELIDEVHGNLLIVDQTKTSNIWSLGVTIWELFELGSQPYCHYSDRQVLTYAIKEQQLKLPKPKLPLSLCDRWYEVMQFCWLQPDQRPTAEEVHLLLSYLCAKGASEAEEEFERRWNSMKPGGGGGSGFSHMGIELSSFPLLEHFSNDGDDVLTVMETSHGLNFEYKWDQGKAEHLPASALSPHGAARYHELYYSASSSSGGGGHLSLGISPSCYECKVQGCPGLHTPGVVPVLSAHSPSLNSEYYIRIEEAASEGSGADLDYTMCSYSPEFGCSSQRWQAKEGHYESSNSPTVSLTMEPLLGHSVHTDSHWEPPEYYSYGGQGEKEAPYYEASPGESAGDYLLEEPSVSEWPVPVLKKSVFTDPLGVSPSMTYSYKEATSDCVTLDLGEENSCGSPRSEGGENDESPSSSKHWASNTSANNNSCHSLSPCEPPANDSWCYRHMITFQGLMAEPLCTLPLDEPTLGLKDLRAALLGGEPVTSSQTGSLSLNTELPTEEKESADVSGIEVSIEDSTDPQTESGEGQCPQDIVPPLEELDLGTSLAVPEPAASVDTGDVTAPAELIGNTPATGEDLVEEASVECPPKMLQEINLENGKSASSEQDRTPDKTVSSASFPDMDEASDEDTAEITFGAFADFSVDCVERQDVMSTFKSLQKQVGTPDSLESLDIPSTTSSCEAFSPTAYVSSSQPKALDSGYDTENYESPEFVLKEPHEAREPENFTQLGKMQEDMEGSTKELSLSSSFSTELEGLDEKNPYRDSAYFSDYDTEGGTREDGEGDSDGSEEHEPEASQVVFKGLGKGPKQNGTAGESVPACPEPTVLCGDSVGCTSPEDDEQVMREGTLREPHKLFINGVAAEELESNSAGDECEGTVAVAPQLAPTRSFFLSPVVMSTEVPILVVEGDVVAGNEGLESVLSKPEQPGELLSIGEGEEAQNNPALSGLSPALSAVPSQQSSIISPDPEEEEDDTEDSDESDEELRCYNIQEQSEESEEDSPTVPIVVAESHSARNLRSLLKMPSLLVESFCDDLERKKKAVSFFDDVTVYLFDQESPTKELAEQPFQGFAEPGTVQSVPKESNSPPSPASQTDTPNSSSERSASEESGGFEWDDDFPLMPVKSSLIQTLTSAVSEPALARLPPTLGPSQKQVLPIQFSRFTVSPAPVSRFSITHVTDSDVESVGGSSEDGDRE
ncbi:serine/threonine-protein kinase LMTK1 isoform X2 [Sphaerodactylus townsendi]|uniref:serine/threonine-protein kinase LMTK1 isoform X2 n=1 Tax=Sphaerodactylus townsendi TaxID=933632 RepID=UPI002025FB12|nr:serine/threonine-protein kinase LMTK1 isoform X2 [Sphaerodactylus townsendi]